ncbi:hypothetical protein [Chryseobacterium ginsenosidimutans]|uniref:hypothetical protein n=1 Tax=Chryseobacterium ginsenosidimutans TaxID=687846 RepID=UPI0031E08B30
MERFVPRFLRNDKQSVKLYQYRFFTPLRSIQNDRTQTKNNQLKTINQNPSLS